MRNLLNKYHNRENGFTLIELLIVVLIIGILAAVAIPVYLGVQSQAKHSAVKADTSSMVHTVQVGITEGTLTVPSTASPTGVTGYSDSAARSDGVTVTTTPTGKGQFQVQGVGTDGYAYTYDSITGQFTESTSIVLGGGGATAAPTITSTKPTATGNVGTAYSFNVTATGTPNPTYAATGLPTGLSLNANSGVLNGTPTTTGTFNYTITVSNGTTPNAVQTGSIVISPAPALYSQDFESTANGAWPSGWNITGSYSKVNTDRNHTTGGTKALYVSDSTAATATSPALTGLTVGQTYTLSVWIYTSGVGGIRMVDSSGNARSAANSSSSNAWTQVTTTFTYQAGDKIGLFASAYQVVYFDDITIS